MIFRLGELFCGPGGLAWGATNADIGDPNWKIVHQWSNDYDENTCKTYRRNICPKQPETVYHEDIRKFDLTHLADIDAQAEEQLELLTRQMAEREGVNEELKAANQMEWVQRMNSIQNRAEEVIKAELIFA